jgi:hypothetical protein
MAGFSAVYAVGESIAQFLRNTYPAELRAEHPCRFEVARSADFATGEAFGDTVVTLYLYRLLISQYLRPASERAVRQNRPPALPLDLHFMVTVWTENRHTEQLLMTWVMAQLHWHPVLDRSNLMQLGGWRADETVKLAATNIPQEELTRLWDVLDPTYRLSTTYVARIVEIDPPEAEDHPPVVASRFAMSDRVPEGAA